MQKISLALGVALSLALAVVGHAQRGGATPEMIATALPVEGAPLAVPGPYKVESGPAFGSPGHVVYHPADLAPFPGKDSLPVMVWGNGGCAINSRRYAGFLTTIASHGFVVLATAALPGATGGRATADNLRAAIAWAETENTRAGSPLNGKIALDRVAVMGQSCGGFMALELGADPRVDTIGVFNSGAQGANAADTVGKLRGPVLLINGHERDFLMASSEATYDLIKSLPAFYGARRNAGHTATVDHPGGGEFANVASNWIRWKFKGDKQAAKMFVGKDCSLCTDPNWVTRSKSLEQ